MILFFAFAICLFSLGAIWPSSLVEVLETPQTADIIIVLGGDWPNRASYAAELYFKGLAPRILISCGMNPKGLKSTLLEHQVPPHVILEETESLNTFQNALRCAPILRSQRVHKALIVTSWFHSRRARQCFRHFSPDIQFISTPVMQPGRSDPTALARARRDYYALFGYFILHDIFPF